EAEADARETLAAELGKVRQEDDARLATMCEEAERTLAASLAQVRADAEHALVERVARAETAAREQYEGQLARIHAGSEKARSDAMRDARKAAESVAAQALEAHLARV